MKATTSIEFETDDQTFRLPAIYEVCPSCKGKGSSSAHLGAFDAKSWAEQDDDFKEDYINGEYDLPCETCSGDRVVKVVVREECNKEALALYDADQKELADLRSLELAEIRAGA